ncbi:MAG TPA: transporter substrate-binding domain-containing protein [Alphaproteobacteria bacterium]|nr:transporter substrate-binding domain-containing protein [Alphaproteobacteria bacterium]
MRFLGTALTAMLLPILVVGAAATARADALDTVMSTHKLRVAVVEDYPPFGSIGANFKPEGYDIDFARLLAARLGVAVELVPVTSANKIPFIVAHRADVLLNIGRTAERAKVVDFSAPYAPYYIGVFGPADLKVKDAADLTGRTIGVTRGSLEELVLTKVAPPSATIDRFEDNSTTLAAFLSGQTQLVALGNIVAAAIVAKHPARMPEQKFLLMNSPVCSAVDKGEARLLARINAAISRAKKDGTLARMSLEWLKQPFPKDL